MAVAAAADSPPDAQRILAPFEAGIRQAHVYRSYLDARLAAEERYADDIQRVLDAHPPPPDEPDGAGDRPRRHRSKRPPSTADLDGNACDAWLAFRHADQAEADARRRRVQLVRQEALKPLGDWCRGQERALENLRRNLQASFKAYEEARTRHLPSARNAYGKKCSELDELTRQEEAAVLQRQQLAEVQARHPPLLVTDDASLSTTMVAQDDASKSDPTEAYSPTGDQQRSLPKFIDAFRNKEIREGWDVAREAAKKTSIFSRRGRDIPEYTYDPAAMEALLRKKARAQREVEELDAKYRSMVIELETLRLSLQHFLVLTGNQCRSHRSELGAELLKMWALDQQQTRFVSNELSVFHSEAEHNATPYCANIQDDVALVDEQLLSRGSLELCPIPYVNQYVAVSHLHALIHCSERNLTDVDSWSGVAQSLLFGVKLMDYASGRNDHSQPPLIVQKCITYLDTYALDVEGIYRVSGKRTALQDLACRAEKDELAFTLSPDQDDPATVAGLLKRYLRELPDPILPLSWENMMHYTRSRVEETRAGWPFLRQKIRKQPPIHQSTLQLILEHLGRVAGNSQKNKMTASNLALVLGPVIFFGATAMEDNNQLVGMEQDRTMEDLIVFGGPIYEDLTGSTSPFSSLLEPAASPSFTGSNIMPSTTDLPSVADRPESRNSVGYQHAQSSNARAPWVQKASLASNLARRVSEGPVTRSKRIQGKHRYKMSSPLPGEMGFATTPLVASTPVGSASSFGATQPDAVVSATLNSSVSESSQDEVVPSPTDTRLPSVVIAGISPPRLPPRPNSAEHDPLPPSRPTSLKSSGGSGGPPPPPIPARPGTIHGGNEPEPRRTSWEGTYLAAQSLLPRRSISSGSGGPPPPPLPAAPQAVSGEISPRGSHGSGSSIGSNIGPTEEESKRQSL